MAIDIFVHGEGGVGGLTSGLAAYSLELGAYILEGGEFVSKWRRMGGVRRGTQGSAQFTAEKARRSARPSAPSTGLGVRLQFVNELVGYVGQSLRCSMRTFEVDCTRS